MERQPSGADGEVYTLGDMELDGTWMSREMDLSGGSPFVHWGNQLGNNQLDLAGIVAVELVLAGGQGQGRLELRNLHFLGRAAR